MVELVIFKVPDGTKTVLKDLAAKRGYMGLSDFLRDLVRRELQSERKDLKAVNAASEDASTASENASKAIELGLPTA